jgi:hypothetical protein
MRKPKDPAAVKLFKDRLLNKKLELRTISRLAKIDVRTVEGLARDKKTPNGRSMKRILAGQEVYLLLQATYDNAVNDIEP